MHIGLDSHRSAPCSKQVAEPEESRPVSLSVTDSGVEHLDVQMGSDHVLARSFQAASLDALDEPVRRYFIHAICDGASLGTGMQLTMAGRIKIGPAWLTFEAEQEFEGHEFVWRARAGWGSLRPLRVVDRYRAAAGSMDGRIFGRLSFLHAAGENTTRASAARGAVESIWTPSSLLPDQGVRWRAEDQNLIVAEFEVPPERPEVRLTIDDVGAVLNVSVMRWGTVGQDRYGYIPFGGNVSEDRRFGDFVLPSKVSVGWWFGTERFSPFFEAAVLAAVPVDRSAGGGSPVAPPAAVRAGPAR